MIYVKFQYALKSLILVLLFAVIGAAIAAPFVQRVLDEYELVGVEITPVGSVALVLLFATLVSGVTYMVRRGSTNTRSE